MVIREAHAEKDYPIELACEILHVARSAYHKWASGKLSRRATENERLADMIEKIHVESPDKGYRRLNDDLRHDYDIHVNDKRVLRICRARDIRSTVKYRSHGCTRRAKNSQYLAENLLNRQFYAEKPNEKWLTDVTEFKWYGGPKVHKLYLSAILDLWARGADKILDYINRPRFCLYSNGLSPPRDILIRFSRYQIIYSSTLRMNSSIEIFNQETP